MWIDTKKKLCDAFGFSYCVFFPRARDAIKVWFEKTGVREFYIPSNVCPLLADILPNAIKLPVSRLTGTVVALPVQLYGYREICDNAPLEIDPLMTGWFGRPFAKSTVISFGRNKTIDIGAGSAFLTNDKSLARDMESQSYFPPGILGLLQFELHELIRCGINKKKRRVDWWNRHLGDSCIRIPAEQVIPWRVIRRVPKHRDAVVKAMRANGLDAGTNYPPLPGVTDPGAIQWGKEVINFFVTEDYDEARIKAACEIIKRTIGQ